MAVVADTNNHRLTLFHLRDGSVWKNLGSFTQFILPHAVAVTMDGALVVTDASRVQVLALDGSVLSVFGPACRLGHNLLGVAVCPRTDEVLVTDRNNHRVVLFAWKSVSSVRRSVLIFSVILF